MRKSLFACGLVLLAAIPAANAQAALATVASTLFESTPFILAGAVCAALSPTLALRMMPYFDVVAAAARSIRASAAA